MTQRFLALLGMWVLATGLAPAALAGIVVYEEGDKKVEVGGRIQLQYLYIDPENGDSFDKLFFRRLRPYVAGSVTENWWGIIVLDFGEALDENEVAVKNAYMRYTGFKNTLRLFCLTLCLHGRMVKMGRLSYLTRRVQDWTAC